MRGIWPSVCLIKNHTDRIQINDTNLLRLVEIAKERGVRIFRFRCLGSAQLFEFLRGVFIEFIEIQLQL